MVLKVVLSKVVCRQETETDGEPISLFFFDKITKSQKSPEVSQSDSS